MSNLKSWEIVTEVLLMLKKEAKSGVSTVELDHEAEALILKLGGKPYNKGYHPAWSKSPFPASICTNVNDVIAHGIPSSYILKKGDLVCFDVGVKKDGICGDGALTVAIDEPKKNDQRLLNVALSCLEMAIEQVKAGLPIKELGYIIEATALKRGYVTNHNYGGHTIGSVMHMSPFIPNFYIDSNPDRLVEGQMICIEPMVTKTDKYGVHRRDWEVVTYNGEKSAMFEAQLLVTKSGYELLTNHL